MSSFSDVHPSRRFNHAKLRASERYEVRLTTKKHKQILHQVHSGKAIYVKLDIETGRSQWLVKLGRIYGKIVHCPKLNVVVTMIPLNREDHKILRTYRSK